MSLPGCAVAVPYWPTLSLSQSARRASLLEDKAV